MVRSPQTRLQKAHSVVSAKLGGPIEGKLPKLEVSGIAHTGESKPTVYRGDLLQKEVTVSKGLPGVAADVSRGAF